MRFSDPLGLKVDLSLSNTEVNRALERIKRTKRGRELYQMMDRDPRICRIISTKGAGFAGRPRGTCDVVIDPDWHPEVATTAGRKSASTERILAHEMGHAATNLGDTGPGRMDNVIVNETPVVLELGLAARTHYDVPSWWLLVYPAPRGVEVPRAP